MQFRPYLRPLGPSVDVKHGLSVALLASMWLGLASAASAPAPIWSKDVKALGNIAVADNGDISFIGSDAKLHRLDSAGKEKWAYTLGDIGRAQPLLTPQGTTLVAAYDDYLQALDQSGKKLWATKLDGDIFAAPALRPDGSVIVATSAGTIYALSNQGQILWQRAAGAAVFSSPVVGREGHIYFGTQGNSFMALSDKGEVLWSFKTGSTVFSSPALDAQGNLYFGSGDKKIYSLTPTGQLRWSYATGGFVNASPIVTTSGLVVVGSYDSKLYALTLDGQKAWDYTATGSIAAPAAELAGGTLLVGDLGGTLHAVNLAGQALWSLKAGEKIDTSVNVSPQGTVYVAAASKLSAFSALPPLADGPWSFYRQVAAGYGRPLNTQEQAKFSALKQAAAQKVLATLPRPSTLQPVSAPKPVTPPSPSSTSNPLSSKNLPSDLAAQIRLSNRELVLPLDRTLSALGVQQSEQLPSGVRFVLGEQSYNLATQRLSNGSGEWVSLHDLSRLNNIQASYQSGQYHLSLQNKPLLNLKLALAELLPLTTTQEFPEVIHITP